MTRTARYSLLTATSLSRDALRVRKAPQPALLLFLVALVLAGTACNMKGVGGNGGGGSSNTPPPPPSAPNVVAVTVSQPAIGLGSYNLPLTSVTVCVPGTSNCQAIDGVLVDTGSSGLRIFASVLSISLPPKIGQNGNLFECAVFARTYTWGSLASADVQVGGELASSATIQIMQDSNPPSSCGASGQTFVNSPESVAYNGILGVGIPQYDCGNACTLNPQSGGNYYVCPSGSCAPIGVPLTQQVSNPVSQFATDNNGVILELPSIPAGGAANVTGSLVFGIGTESNNQLGNATVYPTNQNLLLSANFQGQNYPLLLDSGSNIIGFLDPNTTGEPVCGGIYCPSSVQNVQVGLSGATSTNIDFSIMTPPSGTDNSSYNDIAGPTPGVIDLGLPFFFGRNVYVAIQGMNTTGGPGPYWAF